MRIGILTFHSQLNYGGVLQCWALQQALTQMGHEVVVIDRWYSKERENLLGPIGRISFIGWMKLLIRSLLGSHELSMVIRRLKTMRFLHTQLCLSKYGFLMWEDAPSDLGIECLVVGSDQVWNPYDAKGNGVYLLLGAPKVPAISYAASFGVKAIPDELRKSYELGFARFSKISVREQEGQTIVNGFGAEAFLALDPTLLLESKDWKRMVPSPHVRGKKLLCYFLSEKPDIERLYKWSAKNGYRSKVLCLPECARWSLSAIADRFKNNHVRVSFADGPFDFVRDIANSDCLITDSFHGLVFASIYNVNCRFIRPTSELRRGMFSRAQELSDLCVRGKLFSDTIGEALDSLIFDSRIRYDSGSVSKRRKESWDWLYGAIEGIEVAE